MKRHITRFFVIVLFPAMLQFLAVTELVAQIPLNCDETIHGSISPVGDVDTFAFNAAPNNKFTLSVVNFDDPYYGFQPKVEIRKPDGSLIKSVSANSIRIDTTVAEGTYTIWIMDNDGFQPGNYGLNLECLYPIMGTPITYDTTLRGSISPAPQIDAFTFNAGTNDKLTLSVVNFDDPYYGFQPKVEIYKSDGSLIKRVSANSIRIDTTLPQGTYTIWIMDNDGFQPGNYGLNLERLYPIMGTPITYDTTLHGSISPAPQIDAFTFNAGPNDKLTLSVVNFDDPYYGFQPKVEIYKPDGSLIKRVSANSIRIDTTLPEGTYTIWIMDNDGFQPGNYGLNLERLHPLMGTPITYDTTLRGSISPAPQIDAFTFNAGPNNKLTLSVVNFDDPYYGFQPKVEIYKSDGSLIKSVSANSIRIDTTLPEGTYTIWIMDNDGFQPGNYGLNLERLHPLMGTPITYDTTLRGSISPAPQIDAFTFNAGPNDKLTLSVVNFDDPYYGFQPKVEIYKSDGSLIKRVSANSIRIDTTLPQGTYTIWIMDNDGFQPGNYGLNLERLYPIMGTPITYDTTLHGSISPAPQIDAFTFNAGPNDKLTLSVVNFDDPYYGFQPKVEIYKPDGSLIKRVSANSIRIDTTLPEGTYTIWIMDNDGFQPGNYGLNLECLYPIMGTPITYDTTLRGSISPAPQIDAFTFNAGPNDKLTLSVVNFDDPYYGFQPKVEIYKSDGALIKSVSANSIRIDTTLPQGTYTIWIMDNDGFQPGNYGLNLERLYPIMGTPIQYNTLIRAAVTPAPQIDAFTFNALPNAAITLSVANLDDPYYGFQPKVEIYKSDGSSLKKLIGDNIKFDTTLTGGTYAIWVLDNDGYQTGNFSLILNCTNCIPLPVSMLSFKGQQNGKDVKLTWATASEQNSKEFSIERSLNGIDFTAIGAVRAFGNSNQVINYQYLDNDVLALNSKVLYYRLRQVDIDNRHEYSNVVSIPIEKVNEELMVKAFPNPFNKSITLHINGAASGHVTKVQLYSLEGRLLYQRTLDISGSSTVRLNDLPVLSSGTYLLKCVVNAEVFIVRIVQK